MKVSALLVIVITIVLVACSNTTDSRVLRLGGGDITEVEFRAGVRVALTEEVTQRLCRSVGGLSDEETVEVIVEAQRLAGVKLVQEPVAEDRLRAAVIFKEECARVLGVVHG